MRRILEYKGYQGEIDISVGDDCFEGKVLGIKDLILFEGSTYNELINDFHNAVDDYLDLCEVIEKVAETSK